MAKLSNSVPRVASHGLRDVGEQAELLGAGQRELAHALIRIDARLQIREKARAALRFVQEVLRASVVLPDWRGPVMVRIE